MVDMRTLLLTILALPAVCGASSLKTVSLAECAINGFTIGDSAEVMRQALGEPDRQMLAKLATNDYEHLEFQYDGIQIKFSLHGRTAMSYTVDSPDYTLRSGVGVGSTRAELLDALGPAHLYFGAGPETWSYNVVNSDGESSFAMLRFKFEGNTVALFSVVSR